MTSQLTVTVSATVASLAILEPSGVRTAANGSLQLHVAGRDQFNRAIPAPTGVVWSLTPSASGSVSSTGVFTANATMGWVTITAAANGAQTSINLQVTTADSTPPAAPSGLQFRAGASTPSFSDGFSSVSISWTSNTEPDISSYQVFQDGISIGSTSIAVTGAYNLRPGRSYQFSVMAVDTSSNASGLTTATYTVPSEQVPPTAPNGLYLVSRTDHSLVIGGLAASDGLGTGIAGYELYRDGSYIGWTNGAQFTDDGLAPSTTHVYAARAIDRSGAWSALGRPLSATTMADATAPSVPAGLLVSGTTQSSLTWTWTAASDNVAVTGYDLLIAGAVRVTSAATTATITGLKPGTVHAVSVRARDAIGNASAASAAANGTTQADTLAPTIPGTPTLVSRTAGSISIAWTASSDANGIAHYQVRRNGSQVATTTALVWTDRPLSAATAYAYSIVAVDEGGMPSAASGTLSTATLADTTAPSSPTAPYATSIGSTTIALAWWPATDDVGVTAYEVLRNGAVIGSSATTTYNATNLPPGVTAAYAVRAKDAAGNISPASSSTSLATLGDTIAPGVPTNLVMTTKTAATVALSWTASADPGGSGVVGYDLLRNGAVVASPTATSQTDSGLTANTAYLFTVRARDAAGNLSAASLPLSVTTNTDATVPSVPAGLAVTAVGETSVSLGWAAASDNAAVTGYELLRNGVVVAAVGGLAATDSGLFPLTAYGYAVRALDAGGNRSAVSATVNVTTAIDQTAPTRPAGLMVTGQTASTVSLGWSAASDQVGLSSYRVQRDGIQVGTTSGPTFTQGGLAPVTSYAYTVTAVDLAGNVSEPSLAVTATTTADTLAPATTAAPVATAVGMTSVTLAWPPGSDDVAVIGYDLYRDGAIAGSTAGTTFTDSGRLPLTSYVYALRARDSAGNVSALSATTTATTQADLVAPTVPTSLAWTARTDHSLGLSWAASVDAGGSGVNGYEVLRAGVVRALVTGTTWSDEGLAPDTAFDYAVRAVDWAGNRSAPTAAITVRTNRDETSPTVPADVVSPGQAGGIIALAWSAATDNVGVAGYRIYRDDLRVAVTTGLTWTDDAVVGQQPYAYQVSAVDAEGNESVRGGPVVVATSGANRSVLADAPLFNATQWTGDTAYRSAWLAALEPGRVWQGAEPGSGVPVLVVNGSRHGEVGTTQTIPLAVTGAPNAPVTFFCTGSGSFTANGRNVVTVSANGAGVATVTFTGERLGRIPILVASPLASGQVRFSVQVVP